MILLPHSFSLSLLTCTHSCEINWFGDNCTQHICDAASENGGAPLCQNGGICAVDPRNISNYLCSCPLGYTGAKCQYNITQGSTCMYMHTCTYIKSTCTSTLAYNICISSLYMYICMHTYMFYLNCMVECTP